MQAEGKGEDGGRPNEDVSFRYWAFISYSHQDAAWANWLHKKLETWRVPRRLVGRETALGSVPRRLFPIFRDRDELPSSAELGSVINEALRASRYQIVICSPRAAASRWVNEEIKYFKSLGREKQVLALIVDGEPNATDNPQLGLLECFPDGLRHYVTAQGQLSAERTEPIAADARAGKDGRDDALLKILSGMLNVGFDELKQRERQRQMLRRVLASSAIIALSLLAFSSWRWQQTEKHKALDSQALQTRIAQLYESGRQEFLAHNEARAAVLLNEVYKLGVDTPALRYLLGRAMRVVDAQVLRVQTGSPVWAAELSPDGSRFLTVGEDQYLRVWDAKNGSKLYEQNLGDIDSFLAAFSARGSLIWVYSNHTSEPQHRLRIFNTSTGVLVAQFESQLSATGYVSIDESERSVSYIKPDKSVAVVTLATRQELNIPGRHTVTGFCKGGRLLIAGNEDGIVSLLDKSTGQLRRRLTGLHSAVTTLDSSQDCKTLAAGTVEGAVRVWDPASGEVLMTGGHSQAITWLRLNPEGSRLMSLTRSGVNVWDGHTGALLHAGKFQDPNRDLAAISPDGQLLASFSDARLVLLDPLSGFERYSLDGHQGPAHNFNFSADRRHFISNSSDGSVVVWRLPREPLLEIHQAEADSGPLNLAEPPPTPVTFSQDGRQFFAGGADGKGALWDSSSLQLLLQVSGHRGPLSAAALSPDGQTLATGGWDQSVHLWDIASGRVRQKLENLGGQVKQLSFDPSGYLLSGQTDAGRVKLWEVASGAVVADFERDHLYAQAFSPDGATYAIGDRGQVKLWDTARREFRWSRLLPTEPVSGADIGVIAFSRDGTRLLASSNRQQAFVLDAGNGRILQQTNEPSGAGLSIGAFSPDGRMAAFGDASSSVLLWWLGVGRRLMLAGHSAAVRAVSFSADGALLLSAGEDGLAKIRDTQSGNLLDSFVVDHGAVGWGDASLSLDGGLLLTGGTDNTARLWDIHSETRNPSEIAALLRCRVAWRLDGVALVSAAVEAQGCASTSSY